MKKLHLSKDVLLPLDAITERLAFLGQSGSGKTYAAMRLAELMLEIGAQIIALDPVGPWWGLRAAADGKSAGFPVVVFGGIHADVPITPKAGALVADVIVDRGISAVVDVSDFTIGEMHAFVIDFAERFFDRKKRAPTPVHLFLEEVHTFIPQNLPPDPKAATMLNRMERIVRVGRNHGIGTTQISQMPQSVNKKALNQISTLFAMRTFGKNERKAIKDWMADKAQTEDQLDLDDLLKGLDTGEAWVASPKLLGIFHKTMISKKTTFDSSATPKFGEKLEPPKVLAPVDVAALREAMAGAVAEAEQNDPAALRRRIRELEAQLKKQPAPPAPKIKEVPVFTDEDREKLRSMAEVVGRWQTTAEKYANEIRNLTTLAHVQAIKSEKPPDARPKIHAPIPKQRINPFTTVIPGTSAPREFVNGKLPAGEKAILTAIAQHPEGVTREQLSVLTGYKRSSRDKYLQLLAGRGYVLQENDTILVTLAGKNSLGDFQPLPTGDKLREHWMAKLPEGERRILAIVCDLYPDPVDRDHLSDITGYKRSSRDKYIQLLAARKLITTHSREGVKASGELFG